MRRFVLLLLLMPCYLISFSQNIKRVEPLNWWVGMKNPDLEIMVYGDSIGTYKASFNYSGVKLLKVTTVSNPNYLFIKINIANAKPGDLVLNFERGKKKLSYTYKLLARQHNTDAAKGFNQSDLLYLIMADRFSNGDTKNDSVPSMNEKTTNRNEMYKRHGGDIQGVIDHLDYLKDLGVTAIWCCPLITNDEPQASYHGYAATDFYHIDPRYGSNELYTGYVNTVHAKGMKVVMDFVFNHIGNECWWFKDLPDKSWIHQFPKFTRSNYRPAALSDPHASAYDKMICTNGWFDHHMPDLDQTNEQLATYLTQCVIWWVEYAGIDAYRLDTYPYSDQTFMNRALTSLRNEYPNISIVGETWEQSVPAVAYWQENSPLHRNGMNTALPSCTDFMLCFSIKDGLKEKFGWNKGLAAIYYVLTQDNLYSDAGKNVIFLDNHDLSRIYSELNHDFSKWKMAMTMLMTVRGIPCLYYGTEILMDGFSNPDGKVRKDFPGGWQEDKANKFTPAGRTDSENVAFNFVRTLAQWRHTNEAITKGKLMQFIPEDNTWVYFRYTENSCVMVLFNTSDKEKKLDGERFKEMTSSYKKGRNIIDDSIINDLSSFTLPPNSEQVIELMK